jgi:hypothetical protein
MDYNTLHPIDALTCDYAFRRHSLWQRSQASSTLIMLCKLQGLLLDCAMHSNDPPRWGAPPIIKVASAWDIKWLAFRVWPILGLFKFATDYMNRYGSVYQGMPTCQALSRSAQYLHTRCEVISICNDENCTPAKSAKENIQDDNYRAWSTMWDTPWWMVLLFYDNSTCPWVKNNNERVFN